MLHHLSFTAENPRHVADVLARLIGGSVSHFQPWPGSFIAWSKDGAGTAIEVYPRGTELSPDDGGQARFRHNYFAQKHTGTHAALSVTRNEEYVCEVADRNGWQVQRLDRGGFDVLELWIENTTMIEVLTPAMLAAYLSVVDAPRISASGADVEHLDFAVRVEAEPHEAWSAWVDAAAVETWWGVPEAHIDLRIGGAYELLFLPRHTRGLRGTEGCRILGYVPDRMLTFSFTAPTHLNMGREHTWVTVQFTPTAQGGTDVALSHCGFQSGAEWDQCREYFQKAWRRVLRRFEAFWAAQVVPALPQQQTIDLRDREVEIDLRDLPAPVLNS